VLAHVGVDEGRSTSERFLDSNRGLLEVKCTSDCCVGLPDNIAVIQASSLSKSASNSWITSAKDSSSAFSRITCWYFPLETSLRSDLLPCPTVAEVPDWENALKSSVQLPSRLYHSKVRSAKGRWENRILKILCQVSQIFFPGFVRLMLLS